MNSNIENIITKSIEGNGFYRFPDIDIVKITIQENPLEIHGEINITNISHNNSIDLEGLLKKINTMVINSLSEYNILGSFRFIEKKQNSDERDIFDYIYIYEFSYKSLLPRYQNIWNETIKDFMYKIPKNLQHSITQYLPLWRSPTLLNRLPDELIEKVLSYTSLDKISIMCGYTSLRCPAKILEIIVKEFYNLEENLEKMKVLFPETLTETNISWYDILQFLESKESNININDYTLFKKDGKIRSKLRDDLSIILNNLFKQAAYKNNLIVMKLLYSDPDKISHKEEDDSDPDYEQDYIEDYDAIGDNLATTLSDIIDDTQDSTIPIINFILGLPELNLSRISNELFSILYRKISYFQKENPGGYSKQTVVDIMEKILLHPTSNIVKILLGNFPSEDDKVLDMLTKVLLSDNLQHREKLLRSSNNILKATYPYKRNVQKPIIKWFEKMIETSSTPDNLRNELTESITSFSHRNEILKLLSENILYVNTYKLNCVLYAAIRVK